MQVLKFKYLQRVLAEDGKCDIKFKERNIHKEISDISRTQKKRWHETFTLKGHIESKEGWETISKLRQKVTDISRIHNKKMRFEILALKGYIEGKER